MFNRFKDLRFQKGFTLLEIIIVIVIIGILAAILIPSLISGPTKARDSQRKADLRTLKTKLEDYYQDNSVYPAALSDLTGGSPPYIKTVPVDPKTKKAYNYVPAPAGGPYTSYVLTATLENKNDKEAPNGIFTVDSSQ